MHYCEEPDSHLHDFMPSQEPNLRATQYLPDIVRLQQCLYDSFHHRLDRKEARRMTIEKFLQSLKRGELSDNLRTIGIVITLLTSGHFQKRRPNWLINQDLGIKVTSYASHTTCEEKVSKYLRWLQTRLSSSACTMAYVTSLHSKMQVMEELSFVKWQAEASYPPKYTI